MCNVLYIYVVLGSGFMYYEEYEETSAISKFIVNWVYHSDRRGLETLQLQRYSDKKIKAHALLKIPWILLNDFSDEVIVN